MPDPFVSPSDLERELPFGATDLGVDDTETDADGNTAWDNLLPAVLERETERIERWSGTTFRTETASETLSRPGHVPRRDLPLPERPVQSVQSVTADDEALTEGDDYAVEATHLVLLEAASIQQWPTDYQAIEVEWTYGHDGVPRDVEDALVRLARGALDRVETDGLNSEQLVGAGMWDYRAPGDLQTEVQATIKSYQPPSYYGGASTI